MVGESISHFEILERLGEGGMGVVYKARDVKLDRIVALKLLPRHWLSSEDERERFVVEAKAAASLNHPNICTVYEYDDVDGRPLIAMEYIDGPTLQQKIAESALPIETALSIAGQMALGLARAHASGVIHRDVKPGNVMLLDGSTVKITDFGLAKLASVDLTQPGMALGTVAYMSPEQARGQEVGPETDVWSLGVVLYEMLTAESPFPGEYPSAKLYSVVNVDPEGMDEIEREFGEPVRTLLTSMLQKQPDERPSAADIAPILTSTGGSGTISSTMRGTLAARVKQAGKRRYGTGMIAAVVALAAAVVIAVGFLLGALVGGAGIDLSTSSVAMLPVTNAGSTLEITLNGLIESAASAVGRAAEDQHVLRQMIPFRDVLEQDVRSADEAYGKLGAAFSIETRVTGVDPLPTVEFSLVNSESGEVVRATGMAVMTTNLHQSYLAALRHLLDLLGVSDTPAIAEKSGAKEVDPEAFSLYTRATGLLQQDRTERNLETAIQLYNRALEVSPDYAAALSGLGRAHFYRFEALKDTEDLEKAERYCDHAIELDGDLISAYVTLGAVLVNKGKPGQARAVLERALRQEPFNTEALFGLASVYEALDNFAQAEATLKRAVSSKPEYWLVYSRLGSFYYRRSEYANAADQYQKIIELAPLNALGYRNLGSMYYSMGRLEEAARLWRESLNIEPTYSGLSNLGVLEFNLGDYAAAAQAFEEALAINDKNYQVWGNLAAAYRWLGGAGRAYRKTAKRAAEMAEEWLQVNPRDDEARARLAAYSGELGEIEKSRNLLLEFESRSREGLTGVVAFEVGAAWEELGERAKALDWIETAVDKGYSMTDLTHYPGLEELRQTPEFLRIMDSVSTDASSNSVQSK